MPEAEALFALLQRSLEIPDVAGLQRAFHSVKCLTQADAHILAKDAFGILVKNLSPTDAMTLQGALQREGIDTAVVLQDDLAQLPPPKFVRRMDCEPDALRVYDPIGRAFSVPWEQLMLIAAGNVRHFELKEIAPRAAGAARARRKLDFSLWPEDQDVDEGQVREECTSHYWLEVLLARAATRFHIEAGTFLFTYLGERKRPGMVENFGLLVQDLTKFAPRALVNRGAYFLRESTADAFEYPSKNAFYEEMTWMFWQQAQAPNQMQ